MWTNLKWFYLWIGSLKLLQHIWGKSHQFTVGIPSDLNLRYFINPCKMGYQSISYFKQTNNNYSWKMKWSKYRCTLTMTFYFPQSFSTKFSCYFHMADLPPQNSSYDLVVYSAQIIYGRNQMDSPCQLFVFIKSFLVWSRFFCSHTHSWSISSLL